MSYPMEDEPAGFLPIFDTVMSEKALERASADNERMGLSDAAATLHPQFSFFLSKQPSRWASYLFLGATKVRYPADDAACCAISNSQAVVGASGLPHTHITRASLAGHGRGGGPDMDQDRA